MEWEWKRNFPKLQAQAITMQNLLMNQDPIQSALGILQKKSKKFQVLKTTSQNSRLYKKTKVIRCKNLISIDLAVKVK